MPHEKKKGVNPTYQQPVFMMLAGLLIMAAACICLGAFPRDKFIYERNLCVSILTVGGAMLAGTGACMCCARQEASRNTHKEWQRRQKLYNMPPDENGEFEAPVISGYDPIRAAQAQERYSQAGSNS